MTEKNEHECTGYDAVQAALKRLESVLAKYGCPQGADMGEWLDATLSSLSHREYLVASARLALATPAEPAPASRQGVALSDAEWRKEFSGVAVNGALLNVRMAVEVVRKVLSRASSSQVLPDGCEICQGRKGGVPGNENVIGGRKVCDYCHADGSYADQLGVVALSDAEINEITLGALGVWPSFEAQSWACKVAHAILARASSSRAEVERPQWLRDFIAERRRLSFNLELHAHETANINFFLDELEKAMRATKESSDD